MCAHTLRLKNLKNLRIIEENSDLEDAEDLEVLMKGGYSEDFDDVEDNEDSEDSEDSVNAEDIEDFEKEKNNIFKEVVVEKINEIKMKIDNEVDKTIKEIEEVSYKVLEDWLYRNCGGVINLKTVWVNFGSQPYVEKILHWFIICIVLNESVQYSL